MEISARLKSTPGAIEAVVTTDGATKTIALPARPGGGSGINGGVLLMLALATCYCNDLYREAERLGLPIDRVEVEATADFDGIGLAATNVRYRAKVESSAAEAAIADLLRQTDAVAEVHNTLRGGVPVTLVA